MSLGGEVDTGLKFDPYQSSLSSTAFNKMPLIKDGSQKIDAYDPT